MCCAIFDGFNKVLDMTHQNILVKYVEMYRLHPDLIKLIACRQQVVSLGQTESNVSQADRK